MSYSNVVCYHEPLKHARSREDFYNQFDPLYLTDGAMQWGVSDCGLALTDFQTRYPRAYTLIIHRDRPEPIDGMEDALYALRGLHIRFDDIDRRLEEIHKYLVGTPPDHERTKLFCKLKIVTMEDWTTGPRPLDIWRPFPWTK